MATINPARDVRRVRAVIWAPALALALLGGGCAFQRTAREAQASAKLGVIAGELKCATGTAHTYVLLFALPPEGGAEVRGEVELSDLDDAWGFVCPEGQPFVLGAFQDNNGDGVWNPGEPIGYLGADRPMTLTAQVQLRDVTFEIAAGGKEDPRFPLKVGGDVNQHRYALQFSLGDIITLDDPRFNEEQVSTGMWTPLAALREHGGGIFFLEPYDPNRIPVLFVHGIGGTPRDLRVPIEKLDRTRFQAWVYYYPSGFRLQTLANFLSHNLPRLRDKLGFKTVYIVAHSMGGLVTRRAILDMDKDPSARDIVGLYVTVSSPLAGHDAVKWGLKFTPEPVPAWIDLEPGCPFVKGLEHPLPAHIPYYMLFGYNREGSIFMPASSDSVVPIESELPFWAERDARRIWGFNDDHMKILTDDEPVSVLLGILNTTADEAKQAQAAAAPTPAR